MKLIAIASEDQNGLEGRVSAHFGRCPYYTLVEVNGVQVVNHRVEKNPHFGQHRPGQMPRFIHSLGANVILAGGMGPRAVDMFQNYGIEVATGASGTVGKVLEDYLQGRMRGIVPCQHDHPESCGAHGPGEPCNDSTQSSTDQRSLETGRKRVAIPAQNDTGLTATMDPRFGRAPYFVVLDLESGDVLDMLHNVGAEEAHGAGTSAARLMSERGVGSVVAGRFGPKAVQVLEAMGIELWTAPEGLTVGQALEKLKHGTLTRTNQSAL